MPGVDDPYHWHTWWIQPLTRFWTPTLIRVSEKRNENKTKNAQGAVLMEGASRIWKFVKSNLLRGCMTWTCWAFFCGFALQVSSFVRSTAVCSATFRRDLLLQLPNPYHTIPAITALQATAQLEVAFPFFFVSCVMSIHLLTCLSIFRLAC